MPRLTITLNEERHRALRRAAAESGRSMTEIIDEALAFYGLKSSKSAADLIASARERAAMREQEAELLAVAETRAARRGA
jgi:hypothetical protein